MNAHKKQKQSECESKYRPSRGEHTVPKSVGLQLPCPDSCHNTPRKTGIRFKEPLSLLLEELLQFRIHPMILQLHCNPRPSISKGGERWLVRHQGGGRRAG